MAIVVVASNILVQFPIANGLLTLGAFIYPLAFLVTDITNRVFGAEQARRVVYAGFAAGIVCSLIGSQIMLEFGPAVPLRIGIGSLTAFLAAQLLDVTLFNRLRDGSWWKAPVISSVVSSTLDTVLFFTIAFAGFLSFGETADAQVGWAVETVPFLNTFGPAPLWVTLASADWAVKLAIALVALVPFRVIVGQLMDRRAAA